jgi:hypothetical protein
MSRSARTLGLIFLSASLATFALAPSLMPSSAEGQGRNTAQIFVVQGRVPSSVPGGLAKFGKQNHRNTLQEGNTMPVSERSWRASLIVQFAQPIGDWEYDVLYFEAKGGKREHVGAIQTVHVSDRNEKTFSQKIELKRPDFQPKSKIDIVVRLRGREAGVRRVTLAGEQVRIRYSGTVDFTE